MIKSKREIKIDGLFENIEGVLNAHDLHVKSNPDEMYLTCDNDKEAVESAIEVSNDLCNELGLTILTKTGKKRSTFYFIQRGKRV